MLDLIAAGRANPQIASALFLSPKTVRNVVSAIFTKLHVADRAEAIVRAREAGLRTQRDLTRPRRQASVGSAIARTRAGALSGAVSTAVSAPARRAACSTSRTRPTPALAR